MLNVLLKVHDRLVPPRRRAALRSAHEALGYVWTRVRSGRDRFDAVEIETNSDCNRRCRICPRHKHPRADAYMSEALYRRLLDQLADMGFHGRLSPVFYNEPLLDERLERLVAAAKARLGRVQIVLFTNGSLLTGARLDALADAGVDTFIVSLYERNRRADEAPATSAIRAASARARRRVRYRVLGEEDDLSTSGGLVPVANPVTRTRCLQASTSCVVDHQGNVVLCCNDYYTEHTFGNIGREHLRDIWDKPAYRQLRADLRAGRFTLDICKACAAGTLQARARPAQAGG